MNCPYCQEVIEAVKGKCPKCQKDLPFDFNKVLEKHKISRESLVGQSELDLERELISLIEKANQLEKQRDFQGAIEVLRQAIPISTYPQGLEKKIDRLHQKLKEEDSIKTEEDQLLPRKQPSSLDNPGPEKGRGEKGNLSLDEELDGLHQMIYETDSSLNTSNLEDQSPSPSSNSSLQNIPTHHGQETSQEDSYLSQLLNESSSNHSKPEPEEMVSHEKEEKLKMRKKHATQQAMLDDILGEDEAREKERAKTQLETKIESSLADGNPIEEKASSSLHLEMPPSPQEHSAADFSSSSQEALTPTSHTSSKKISSSKSHILMQCFVFLGLTIFLLSFPLVAFVAWKKSHFVSLYLQAQNLLRANKIAAASLLLQKAQKDPFFFLIRKSPKWHQVYLDYKKKNLIHQLEEEIKKPSLPSQSLYSLLKKLKNLLEEKEKKESLKDLIPLKDRKKIYGLWKKRIQILLTQGKTAQPLEEAKKLSQIWKDSKWRDFVEGHVKWLQKMDHLEKLYVSQKYRAFSQVLNQYFQNHFLDKNLWQYYHKIKKKLIEDLEKAWRQREWNQARKTLAILEAISPFQWEKKIYGSWKKSMGNE